MKKNLSITILVLCISTILFSQKNSNVFNADGENAIYKTEWSVGLRFHTNAVSGFFEHVWIKDIKKRKLFQINIFGYNDIRDKKINSISPRQFQSSKKYYYGRINDFVSVQLLYGNRSLLANKSETSGVKLSFTYMAGVSLGALIPYYIEIENKINESYKNEEIRYLKETKIDFLDKNKILGESTFLKGFNKMSFTPGLTAKVGLNFDFARKNSFVTSIEVGSQLDVFYKKIEIYANDANKPYILNLYISFQIGKRS